MTQSAISRSSRPLPDASDAGRRRRGRHASRMHGDPEIVGNRTIGRIPAVFEADDPLQCCGSILNSASTRAPAHRRARPGLQLDQNQVHEHRRSPCRSVGQWAASRSDSAKRRASRSRRLPQALQEALACGRAARHSVRRRERLGRVGMRFHNKPATPAATAARASTGNELALAALVVPCPPAAGSNALHRHDGAAGRAHDGERAHVGDEIVVADVAPRSHTRMLSRPLASRALATTLAMSSGARNWPF